MKFLGVTLESEATSVKKIVDRILSSYGVRTRQAYSDLTKIPLPTISNWVKRGKVPGDYILQCALDTGADVKWLAEGIEVANARSAPQIEYGLKGKALLEAMQNSGGRVVLRRIMDAYKFEMQKQLGEHLDIPSGTMSAWLRREHFPGEIVIACALDTGVSLYWLATGNGGMYEERPQPPAAIPSSSSDQFRCLPKFDIHTGQLVEAGSWICDPSFITFSVKNAALLFKGTNQWCVSLETKAIGNGRWVIDLDGIVDVYDVSRLPGNRLNVRNESAQFECQADDIECVGMVLITLNKNA
ncbi:phage repressor protein CI [Pantoea agglomerans]|uniref:helix-turn-helix domain-containing protein n=1 Tax=Enterobacter agglomerans TaxID=549 RepID=UPI0013BD335D|nr:helix-turn-helix domain-containing protein [Pantoea agglomerans]NEG85448.1 phage repressor protein CI [Pantoea agglomerans]NEH07395.1 phage repressor protein CI [Pantoea agglomerans]